eukprot:5593799-Pyramimonas_sp.AAC.1
MDPLLLGGRLRTSTGSRGCCLGSGPCAGVAPVGDLGVLGRGTSICTSDPGSSERAVVFGLSPEGDFGAG